MSEEPKLPASRWAYMGACRYCGDEKPKRLFRKLKATSEVDTSGSQPTVEAVWWPWAECEGCGHQSEGKVVQPDDDASPL